MSSWADRQKKNEERLRGLGKHEALLLECRLREHRHPFQNSLQMKVMDREKKKIEAELLKIRHTIHHERRNPRAAVLSTRSLTMEAVAPRRCKSTAGQITSDSELTRSSGKTSRGVAASRLSLDPSLLTVRGERSFPLDDSTSQNDEKSAVGRVEMPSLQEINEDAADGPQIIEPPSDDSSMTKTEAVSGTKFSERAVLTDTAGEATKTDEPTTQNTEAQIPSETVVHSQPKASQLKPVFLDFPAPRLCRRQPTFLRNRDFTFMNRSNTYIKRRKEMSSSSNVLSCANYNEMRRGIADETLKKLGLM